MDEKKFLPAIIFVLIIFSFGRYKFFYEPALRYKIGLDAAKKFLLDEMRGTL
ncbi:MAG: hypothetical protein IJG80_04080 [Selenomonadaceae bacterium]|nr:hypothetical protein [Selenomonadaceae bacterium]MBQ3726131.1 hypothetical protein [Selenomonadaceae bacterium]MBQ9496711.1 hypothetical protein [Selenomonadaceae bacterium]